MRKVLVVGVFATLVIVLVATASALASGAKRDATVRVSTRKVPKLGTILVNAQGRTLYMFVPDKQRRVTCVKACAAIWPPLKLATGAKATASGGARASLLGSDRNPGGGRVVTYNKWPLYTYISDRAAGQTKGQALNLNGGLWYVLSPSGKVIR